VALVLLLGACGSDDQEGDSPDKATSACRGQWKDLGKQVRGNDEKTNPSALTERWNSVVATIDYYESSATSKGCDEALSSQKDAITALTAFGTKLAPYDMELRLQEIRDDAEAYAEGPPAPSPSPSPTPTSRDKKKQPKKKVKAPPAPPTPAQIGVVLKTFTTQAPLATQQQGPGWEQARVTELSDPAAVAKAIKDLAFLSTESPAWRTCAAALVQIKTALAAAAK
jgi:hypothetical protein